MFQSSTSLTNNDGHDSLSIHPILTVLLEFSIIDEDSSWGFWFSKSIPSSFITETTTGLRWDDGDVPAPTSITTGTTGVYNAVYGKDGRIKGQEKDKDEEDTEKDKEEKEKERKG